MSNTGAPSFPTSSLYTGSFPSFPSYKVGIGSLSFYVPNITAIPQWIGSLVTYAFLWAFGWIAAVLEYFGEAFDYYTITPFTQAINYLLSIFDNVLNIFEQISRFAGPFQIDVAAALMGILLLGIIVGSYIVIKGVSALIAGGE